MKNVAIAATPSRDSHDVRHCENARHARAGLPRWNIELTSPTVVSSSPTSSSVAHSSAVTPCCGGRPCRYGSSTIAEVHISGTTAFWSAPWLGVDALRAGHRIVERLWEHARDVHARVEHPLIGRPSLLITELVAGGRAQPHDHAGRGEDQDGREDEQTARGAHEVSRHGLGKAAEAERSLTELEKSISGLGTSIKTNAGEAERTGCGVIIAVKRTRT